MSTENEWPSQTLHDEQAYPTVSFDTRLGKQVSRIDFDYPKYVNTLQESGLSLTQISNTTVEVLPKQARMVDGGAEEGKPIQVNLGKHMDNVLAHETAHYTDFIHNPRTSREKTHTALTNLARKLSLPFMLTGSAGEIASSRMELGEAAKLGSTALIGAGVVLYVGALVSYATNKRERHAFKVQKADSNQYFTTEPR